MAFIFLFLSFFLSFPLLHVKIFLCWSFLKIFIARILKLGIHKDNKLLYCGIENRTPCSYFSPLFVHFSVF